MAGGARPVHVDRDDALDWCALGSRRRAEDRLLIGWFGAASDVWLNGVGGVSAERPRLHSSNLRLVHTERERENVPWNVAVTAAGGRITFLLGDGGLKGTGGTLRFGGRGLCAGGSDLSLRYGLLWK